LNNFLQLLAFIVIAFIADVATADYADEAKSGMVVVETASAKHRFCTQVVSDPAAKRQGLKHRHHLASGDGMLFLFEPPQTVKFWMKETYIPLDMLFFDIHGNIVSIAERTEPLSFELIGPPDPVQGVLEIYGGLSEQLNIRTGDRISRTADTECRQKAPP
jgi:uncharacterized protein